MAVDVHKARHVRLGVILLAARKSAGFTQMELAERMGRPQSFVSKYERGERRLDVFEFLEVAVALEIDPSQLIKRLGRP